VPLKGERTKTDTRERNKRGLGKALETAIRAREVDHGTTMQRPGVRTGESVKERKGGNPYKLNLFLAGDSLSNKNLRGRFH